MRASLATDPGIRRRKPIRAVGMDASAVYWPSPALFPWYVVPSAAGPWMNDTGPYMHFGLPRAATLLAAIWSVSL